MLSRKRALLQNDQMSLNFHLHGLLLFYWYKDPTLHLLTFGFFHCNRYSSWFQEEKNTLNLLQEGKIEVQLSACFLPLSVVSAFLCAFLNLASST